MVAVVILFIVALNLASWLIYFKTRRMLDEQLGMRLEAIALTASKGISIQDLYNVMGGQADDYSRFILKRYLQKIKEANSLESIFIFDGNLLSVTDTREEFQQGDFYAYLSADSTSIKGAWGTGAGYSQLREIQNNFFKSGYASISDLTGNPMAMVSTDASADFLKTLKSFRAVLAVFSLVSTVIMLIVVTGMFRSIRALVSAQEEVMRSDRLVLVGKMAAGVAHEIRNPLGIIRSTADLIRRKYGESGDELFDFIPTEVERVDRMVDDFLFLARKRALNLQDVDVSAWIEDVGARLEPLCKVKDASLSIEKPSSLPTVRLDPLKSEAVIRNLVLNALAALDGTRSSTVTVKASIEKLERRMEHNGRKGGRYGSGVQGGSRFFVVEVEDNGPGIPKDEKKKIFEPFFTTKSAGTGLGLPIGRAAMESHKGFLTLEKSENGAVFRCWFPLSQR